jgi:hypothetical protein
MGDKFEDIEREQFGKDGCEDAVAQIANRASARVPILLNSRRPHLPRLDGKDRTITW